MTLSPPLSVRSILDTPSYCLRSILDNWPLSDLDLFHRFRNSTDLALYFGCAILSQSRDSSGIHKTSLLPLSAQPRVVMTLQSLPFRTSATVRSHYLGLSNFQWTDTPSSDRSIGLILQNGSVDLDLAHAAMSDLTPGLISDDIDIDSRSIATVGSEHRDIDLDLNYSVSMSETRTSRE